MCPAVEARSGLRELFPAGDEQCTNTRTFMHLLCYLDIIFPERLFRNDGKQAAEDAKHEKNEGTAFPGSSNRNSQNGPNGWSDKKHTDQGIVYPCSGTTY